MFELCSFIDYSISLNDSEGLKNCVNSFLTFQIWHFLPILFLTEHELEKM